MMDDFLIFFIYCIPGFILFAIVVINIFVSGKLDFRKYSLLNLIIIYFLVPVYLFFTHEGVSVKFIRHGLVDRTDLFLVFFPFAWVCILAFFLGCRVSAKTSYAITVNNFPPVRSIILMAIIGVLCLSIFIYLYGGLNYVMMNISKIRSGTDENKNYLGAFIKLFSNLLVFATIFAYSHLRSNTKWCLPIFLVSLLLTFFKLYLDGGRGNVINFLIGLYFVYILSKGKVSFLPGLLVIVFSYLIGVYGKIYIFALFTDIPAHVLERSLSQADGGMSKFVQEYSHQFLSSLIAIQNGPLIPDRLGLDFVAWILKPFKLLGIEVPDSISYYNTYLVTGEWDSEIPPGIIALGLYNFGVLFFWVPVFLWGMLCSALDKSIKLSGTQKNPNTRALHAILFIFLPFGLLNSDPALFVQHATALIVFIIILLLSRRMAFRRIKFHHMRSHRISRAKLHV